MTAAPSGQGTPRTVRVLMMIGAIQMGGAERVLIRLLPHLASEGVDVTVCTVIDFADPGLAAELVETGVPWIRLGARRTFDLAAWWRLRRRLVDGGFDLVHAHDSQSQTLAGFVGRTTRVPVIMTRHVMADALERPRSTTRARAARWAARVGATEVVTVSDAVGTQVREQTGVPAARVRTIYNGIDTDHFAPRHEPQRARADLGWEAGRPTVAMVAVMRSEKGHDVLAAALPRLRERVPDVAVKLVGIERDDPAAPDGSVWPGDVVEVAGVHHDVRPVLEASDVVVLPSWIEALPTVLLEAGAMARPVVATRVGGIPEIVDDGRTGLLVEAGDAVALADGLADLLLDEPRSRAMGCAARHRVTERFSFPVQAAALRALYDDVVAGR